MANLTIPIKIDFEDIKAQLIKEGWEPVIHCRDCAFAPPKIGKDNKVLCYLDYQVKTHDADWFCKGGKRREEND